MSPAIPFQQTAYRIWHLRHPEALAQLAELPGKFEGIGSALRHGDADLARSLFKEINNGLIKMLCNAFLERLDETARQDCARLIAETLLHPEDEGRQHKAWEDWLDVAPCWPQLAREQWEGARSLAATQVLEQLAATGIDLPGTAREILKLKLLELKIADVLPGELCARFFPEPQEGADEVEKA